MKRYMVFSFAFYYPTGGMNDFVDSFDDLEEAKRVATRERGHGHDYDSHIVDLMTGKIIDGA